MQNRVVITGIGVVSALGHTLAESWQAISDGSPGIARIQTFDPEDLRVKVAAEVKAFDSAAHFENGSEATLDREYSCKP